MEFIERVETEDTGGHVLVDYIYLKNGYVIGITDDSVCLFTDVDEYKEYPKHIIWLP